MAKDCRETALSFLEHRERSAYEVRTHLASKGFQEKEIEEELRFLQELHYVDDGRYCSAYIEYGIRKGRGPVRLQRELAEKGINAAMIRQAMEENFDRQTEKDMAMQEAQKLLRRGAGPTVAASGEQDEESDGRPDEKTVAKIGRKLASLGYHTDIIYDVIGRIRKS